MEISESNFQAADELKVYRGGDFKVAKHIIIKQPTLGEICDYGEKAYYEMVYGFTATPQSMKAQLWDKGVDYTKITPFELFCLFLCRAFSQQQTSLLFGDLDFQKFQLKMKEDTKSLVLSQVIDEDLVIIDEFTYSLIVNYLCQAHFIVRDLFKPANEPTKMFFIEQAKEEILLAQNRKTKEHSMLKNLVSAMINSEGFKYNHSQVWDMKINAFMDSVKRISKIKSANLLLQSGYSGFGINLKDINKKELDWIGELD